MRRTEQLPRHGYNPVSVMGFFVLENTCKIGRYHVVSRNCELHGGHLGGIGVNEKNSGNKTTQIVQEKI